MEGVLLVDKPAGWTSFDVVNYVRRIVATAEGKKPKQVKVGHTGTLDPFATGLLVLLVGKNYTRRAGELSKLDKTYEVTMRLGEVSTTGDPEGIIIPYRHPEELKRSTERVQEPVHKGKDSKTDPVSTTAPTLEALQEAVERFRGPISQVPPAYSAIKVNGQRAYKLARAGKEIVLEARPVTIHTLEIISYDYPKVRLRADVSSGTYIRTLVEDLGRALGIGAYTVELRRVQVGPYSVAHAQTMEAIRAEAQLELREQLQ